MNYLEDGNTKISDSRIIILLGNHIVDGNNRDGEVDVCPRDKDNDFDYHALALDYYLNTHFKDNEEVQKSDRTSANSIAFNLAKSNAIVGFENTSVANHNSMLFFFPKELSRKQKNNLKLLQKKLKDENYEINIYYNLTRHPEDYTIAAKSKMGNSSILNDFIYDKSQER